MSGPDLSLKAPAPTQARRPRRPVTPAGPIAGLTPIGVPRYLHAPTPAGGGYLPGAEARAEQQDQSLKRVQGKGDADRTVATRASSPGLEAPGQVHRELQMTATTGGERGALEAREWFAFSIEPPRPFDVQPQGELKISPPEERLSYPVNLSFSRSLFCADKNGRIVRVEVAITLGMLDETWQRQTASSFAEPSWTRMRGIQADAATAMITVDGSGTGKDGYFGYAVADMPNASVDQLMDALVPAGGGGSALPARRLVDPDVGPGEQFDALQGWLDTVDAERAEAARVHVPWYKRAGLAMAGALYSFGNMIVEAGKQLWDMDRLLVAVTGKATGLWDYMPVMSSEIGKAAEDGQGTTEILGGMVKGMINAPRNAWEAAKRDDWFAFGEQAFNTYLTARTVEGLTRTGVRTVGRGFRGLRGAPAAAAGDPWAAGGGEVPASAPEGPVASPQPTPVPDTPGQARIGDVGRHSAHGARGGDLISEHVTPGEIWRQIMGEGYEDAHYNQDSTVVWERSAAHEKTDVGPTRDSTRIRDVQNRARQGEPINVMDEVTASIDKSLQAREAANSQVEPGRIVEAGMDQLQEKFDSSPGRLPGTRIRARANALRWLTELNDPATSVARKAVLRRKLASGARSRRAELQATGRQVGQGNAPDFEAIDWEGTFSADPAAPAAAPTEYWMGRGEGPTAPADPTTSPARPAPAPADVAAPAAEAAPQAARATPADPVQAARQRGGVFRVLAGLAGVGKRMAIQLTYRRPPPPDTSRGVRILQTVADLKVAAQLGSLVGAYAGNGEPLNLGLTPDRPYWVIFRDTQDGSLSIASSALLNAGQENSSPAGLGGPLP